MFSPEGSSGGSVQQQHERASKAGVGVPLERSGSLKDKVAAFSAAGNTSKGSPSQSGGDCGTTATTTATAGAPSLAERKAALEREREEKERAAAEAAQERGRGVGVGSIAAKWIFHESKKEKCLDPPPPPHTPLSNNGIYSQTCLFAPFVSLMPL